VAVAIAAAEKKAGADLGEKAFLRSNISPIMLSDEVVVAAAALHHAEAEMNLLRLTTKLPATFLMIDQLCFSHPIF
jgi:hypothetical protein